VRLVCCGLVLVASAASAADSPTGWFEVKGAHVTVKSNLSLDAAKRAVVLAETTRSALLAAAWPGATLPQDRLQLVVFFSHQDFQYYFGDFVPEMEGVGGFPPTVFLYGLPDLWEKRSTEELEVTTSVLKRVLVEHLELFFYRRLPRWFSVGLAEFFETLRISAEGKAVSFGGINVVARSLYFTHRTLDVANALAWGSTFNPSDEATLLGLRGLSWVMVEWMYSTHLPEFVRFQNLLVSGMDPTKAWNLVLPKDVTENIDRELNFYARYGALGGSAVPLPEGKFTSDSGRPMTAAEVHAIRAEAALAGHHTKEVSAEVAAALADDPGNVTALRIQLPLVKPAERLGLARRSPAAHPSDALAWLLLGDALKEAGEAPNETRAAYKKATELAPDHPLAFNALAAMALAEGSPKDALPLALTSVQMAPWDPVLLDTLASALAGLGRCSESVSMEARAMDRATESASAPRSIYATRLAEIHKTCNEAPASKLSE
jgi:hypothetical protein